MTVLKRLLASGLLSLLAPATALAQGFAAYVSPPRFEASATPGKPQRLVLEIQHVGTQAGSYRFYTNDWTLGADQSVNFTETLTPGSCRPWVAIERRELTLNPGSRYRYRFEVTPPADAPVGECRFALMIEGRDPAQVQGPVPLVGGRIGVIVYVAIGNAAPTLEITGARVQRQGEQLAAILDVRNSGTAHGRLDGVITGTDASGRRIDFAPATLPILPQETRSVALSPMAPEGSPEGTAVPVPVYPVDLKGNLDYGKQRLPVAIRLIAP